MWFIFSFWRGYWGAFLLSFTARFFGFAGILIHVWLRRPWCEAERAAHPRQVVGDHGEPVEPVHTRQAKQLDLPQWPIGFTPPKDWFDQFAFLMTDGTPFVSKWGSCRG
jgi:hypothetical protein